MYINTTRFDPTLYRKLANCIRVLTIDAVEKAESGHPGMPMGMADVATVLFAEFLIFNPDDPKWINRDRLIFSAGHGSMLLYSLLYLSGYNDISLEDIKNFRQVGSKTPGHPEYGSLGAVECTTGPLGQGLANAVGMAIAQKHHNDKLSNGKILDHSIYAIVSDGCIMEGISHEASSLAGHLRLDNLIVLYDSNNITIDGSRSLTDSEDVAQRFKAYNWYVQEIDGHDFAKIKEALANAKTSTFPSLIICKTVIGYGAPSKSASEKSHGAPLGNVEVRGAKEFYMWEGDEAFSIPQDLLNVWRKEIGTKSQSAYIEWCASLAMLTEAQKTHLSNVEKLEISADLTDVFSNIKLQFDSIIDPEPTRKSSGRVISELLGSLECFIGGSADLSESNHTFKNRNSQITKDNFSGNYIYYGIREHAMGGIMNGIALYGGLIPYGGTFLIFLDYCKPAIRMAALMKQQVIYIATHDSIGVGEDGPTHQPIEQLSSLRAVPNLNVLRPADIIETIECWEVIMESKSTPSVLCLTRQNVPRVRLVGNPKENLCKKGAYILSEYIGKCDVTIFATGSEVSIALEAQRILRSKNIGVRVVSMPCSELFDIQPEKYRLSILSNPSVKIAIEAGIKWGWERYIGEKGVFIGMDDFGISGKGVDLFKYFGITSQKVVECAQRALNKVLYDN